MKNFAVVRFLDVSKHILPIELRASAERVVCRKWLPQSFVPARAALTLVFLLVVFCALSPPAFPAALHPPSGDAVVSPSPDPDKPASEMNHHIAGLFLIVIGLSLICSKRYQSLEWMRWLLPILFVSAGLFLAAWSDSEIWPRGELTWSWLRYDAEARQHKLYALLLLVLGMVEAVQASPKLRRPQLKLAFPVLCVIGGIALLFHQHGGHVMAGATATTASQHQHQTAGPPHSHSSPDATASPSRVDMQHQPLLTGSMENIQQQHAWFAAVGFCVALFKVWHDAARPPARVQHYLWANSVIALGVLLLFYRE